MERRRIKYLPLLLLLSSSCKHELQVPGLEESGYPRDVGIIMLTKCATAGCHNNLSYEGAASLNLTTWEKMMTGGAGSGAVVVPFRPDFSPLCYFTNTDTTIGPALIPTMPLNQQPLAKDEYILLRNWIANGAPNARGDIKFADDASRKKFYITNRMCDVVTVLDAATLLQMRYVDAGNKSAQEFPTCVHISPDKQHWYVSFYAPSTVVQKFSAADDRLVEEINLGLGVWTSFVITADSKRGFFVDNSSPGKVVYADLEQNKILATYTFGGNFKYPLGIAINEQQKKIYVGSSNGNFVYNIHIPDPLSPVIHEMPIDGKTVVQYNSVVDPITLLADPVSNKCFIACERSKEIRVLDMVADTVIAAIPLGSNPAHMGLSAYAGKLFVSCPDDLNSFPGNRGSVAIIDLQTYAIHSRIKTGFQPYGIAIDDERKLVAVVNANISSEGPGSHHSSKCGSKNGNVTFIDLNTLGLVPGKKRELAVFPFGAAAR